MMKDTHYPPAGTRYPTVEQLEKDGHQLVYKTATDHPEPIKVPLPVRMLSFLHDLITRIAKTGTRVDLAMGFTEYARDIGPFVFLANGNYEMDETEVQVFARPIVHTYADAYGEFSGRLCWYKVRHDVQDDLPF